MMLARQEHEKGVVRGTQSGKRERERKEKEGVSRRSLGLYPSPAFRVSESPPQGSPVVWPGHPSPPRPPPPRNSHLSFTEDPLYTPTTSLGHGNLMSPSHLTLAETKSWF